MSKFSQAHNDHLDPDRHDSPESNEWVTFTKRTNDPKLGWLEKQLSANGISSRRHGESFHAPVLEVKREDVDRAWEILNPVDDLPDDSLKFQI